MKIVCEKLLASFRGMRRCEWCGLTRRCDAAHVQPRGIGGGSRLDIPSNLLSLCRPCHIDHHDGKRPSLDELEAKVAIRLETTQEAVRAEVKRARAIDKHSTYFCAFTDFAHVGLVRGYRKRRPKKRLRNNPPRRAS